MGGRSTGRVRIVRLRRDPIRLVGVTNAAEVRLRQGYRVIRQMAGDGESPWPGALVCGPTGETAVAVDADLLGEPWRGWTADPGGHVLAPQDVLRRPDGHDVLLPVCTERLSDFLDRRGSEDLSAGEGVTIAVSLLRGLGQLEAAGDDVCGTWWLTEAGCPVFATETSEARIVDQTTELLERIAHDVPVLADAVTDVIGAVDDARRGRVLERVEAAIFAVAEPTALATTTFGPRRARDRVSLEADEATGDAAPEPQAWPFALSRHLDGEWADLVSRATTGVWRALRAPHQGRRRPWLVAGGLACAIVAGGLLWPTGDGGPATAGTSLPSATPVTAPRSSASPQSPPADGEPAPTEDGAVDAPPDVGPSDLAGITTALLTARTGCAGDPTCLEGVLENRDARYPPGVVDLDEGGRSLSVLDEFGGAAVLRAEAVAAEAAPQLVVVVQIEGRWLLRDVYDIAEQ
jgi:hypothetical protein